MVTHVPVTIWDRICNIQRAALLPHHLKDRGSGTIIGTGVGDRDHNRLRGQHIQQMWGDGIPVAMMRQLDKCTGRDFMLLPAVGIHIAGQLHGSFLADQPQADAGVVDKAI